MIWFLQLSRGMNPGVWGDVIQGGISFGGPGVGRDPWFGAFVYVLFVCLLCSLVSSNGWFPLLVVILVVLHPVAYLFLVSLLWVTDFRVFL